MLRLERTYGLIIISDPGSLTKLAKKPLALHGDVFTMPENGRSDSRDLASAVLFAVPDWLGSTTRAESNVVNSADFFTLLMEAQGTGSGFGGMSEVLVEGLHFERD